VALLQGEATEQVRPVDDQKEVAARSAAWTGENSLSTIAHL